MTRANVKYDHEDFSMDIHELQAKYPNGHPEHTIVQWQAGPIESPNFNGYWDWVVYMIKEDDDKLPPVDAATPYITPGVGTVIDPNTNLPMQEASMINPNQAKKDNSIIPINDTDIFAGLITEWHGKRIHDLKQLIDIPAGSEAEYVGKDGKPVKVTLIEDCMTAFQLGIHTALSMFEQLPFEAIPEDGSNISQDNN